MNRKASKQPTGSCRWKSWPTIALLVIAAGSVAAEDLPPFAERAARAKDMAQQEQVRRYLRDQLHPVADPFMAKAIRMCTDHPCASTEPFAVVADITPEGNFSRIDFQPKTDSSECFANSLARLRVPMPPPGDNPDLPVVFEMKIKP